MAKPIKVESISIGARDQGWREVRFVLVDDRARYSLKIAANPRDVDPADMIPVRRPMEGLQQGDEGWFHPEAMVGVKGRRIALAVWAEAERQGLITPDAFARADARRVMEAEAYRRSRELFAILGGLVDASDIGNTEDDDARLLAIDNVIRRARRIREEIEDSGRTTYETVLKALEKVMKAG